jgi:p-hydroxybenzoic acid efflux pump subunit AaeB
VLKGTLIGATAGVAWHLFLLPHASNALELVALIAPFLAFSAYGMTRPGTAKAAIDGNMSFLLVTHPALPVVADAPDAIAQACAILLGVVAAVLAFRFILPVRPAQSARMLAQKLNADLRSLGPDSSESTVLHCRARMIRHLLGAATLAQNARPLLSVVTALAALARHRDIGRLTPDQRATLHALLETLSQSPGSWPQHADSVLTLLAALPETAP